jgi:type IV secretory pathway VirD2 relaxase
MTDLRTFTRDLAVQMESDLGTRLDWVGVVEMGADDSASSTCGWTIRRRRSAGAPSRRRRLQKLQRMGSPRLQGRANE